MSRRWWRRGRLRCFCCRCRRFCGWGGGIGVMRCRGLIRRGRRGLLLRRPSMSEYTTTTGKRFRRKNLYLPCALAVTLDDLSDDDYAEIMQATYWADLIAGAEWKVVLEDDAATAAAKSRLKKKMIGWWMALGRIAALRPDLYNLSVTEAAALYQKKIGTEHPVLPKGEPS